MNSAGIPAAPPGDHEPPDGPDLARRVTVLETRFDTVLPTLATKTDLAELRIATKSDLAELRIATRADLADLRTELLVKLEVLRAEMGRIASNVYKWMAATLITILLSFIGMFVGLTKTLTATPIPAPAPAASSPQFDQSSVVLRPQPVAR
jgi:hypothetical protein